MHFLATADWHIGRNKYGKIDPETGFHTQGLELLKVITNDLIPYAENNGITDIFVIGDVFHKRNPLSIDWELLNRILERCIQKKLHVYLICGNHDDLTKYTTALTPLSHLGSDYINIISEEEHIYRGTKPLTRITMLPFFSKRWAKLSFSETIDQISKENKYDKEICMCHELIDGASYNGHTLESNKVKSSELEKNFDLVLAGDIHQHQQIKSNIYYTGTPIHLDYGDAAAIPGFLDVDTDTLSVKHIPTNTRGFHTIAGQVQFILKTLEENDYSNQVLKLVVTDKQVAISEALPVFKQLEKNGTILIIESHPIIKKAIRKELAANLSTVDQFREYGKHNKLTTKVKALGKKILEDLAK